MKLAGFAGTLLAGFFSVFLLTWRAYNDAGADWVYGFLAVFWSMIMMLRLMTLTEPLELPQATGYLAQKILRTLRVKQEQMRRTVLETAFGGSFVLFLAAGIFYAGWQIYCAVFPAAQPNLDGLTSLMAGFAGDQGFSLVQPRFFDWGQGFLLFLSFAMMGFVLRSYAIEKSMTRPALLVLSGYAVAGFITCFGLNASGGVTVESATLSGSGAGALSYLLSTLPAEKALTLFDILLMEGGVIGIALLAFLLFVPVGYIALSAQQGRTDRLVLCCGLIAGLVLILSVFMVYSPPVPGFMTLAAMGLFLAWGASETALRDIEA